jgi:hypothetical protein
MKEKEKTIKVDVTLRQLYLMSKATKFNAHVSKQFIDDEGIAGKYCEMEELSAMLQNKLNRIVGID